MHIVLWDTEHGDAGSDLADCVELTGRIRSLGFVRRFILGALQPFYAPVSLDFAYLAAVLRRLGHSVEYAVDCLPPAAQVYVFRPTLLTLQRHELAIRLALKHTPRAKILVIGPVAERWPERFNRPQVTVLKGDAERLLWCFDDVYRQNPPLVNLGRVDDLDRLPRPNWALFEPEWFRLRRQFRRHPTGRVEHARWLLSRRPGSPPEWHEPRYRAPERVVSEMRRGMELHGFASYELVDARFGADNRRALRLAELIGRLPGKIEFSIRTTPELVPLPLLRALRHAGLASVTLDLPALEGANLAETHVSPDDPGRRFVASCASLGIRTTARYRLPEGIPDAAVLDRTWQYARLVNATFAELWMAPAIAPCDNLPTTAAHDYRLRWSYLRQNLPLLWPAIGRLGTRRRRHPLPDAQEAHTRTPRPLGVDSQERKNGLRTDGPHRNFSQRRDQGPGAR